MTKRRGSRAVWYGVPIIITCRLIRRYVWTTASIDVWVDGNRVLESGGVLKMTGSHAESFHFRNTTHEAPDQELRAVRADDLREYPVTRGRVISPRVEPRGGPHARHG